jgi:ubiquinone/menaquinone biosynthesis C-methylase UbiE
MRDDYDDLRDLWYAWWSSRLHFLIAKHLLVKWDVEPRRVLDVGCGTGFQSFLYALTGAGVVGVDISDQLLAVARHKAETFRKRLPCALFPSYFTFVSRYDELIGSLLKPKFLESPFIPPRFEWADATNLPFDDNAFDHLNCCGSTLSFIADYPRAIKEFARVLKPGGTFVLEVEAKYNLDLFWTLADTVALGHLHYDTSFMDALRALTSPIGSHCKVKYPFGDERNPVYMDLSLFSRGTLLREMHREGLKATKTYSIHSVTNLIPSTYLDQSTPSRYLIRVFSVVARIEEMLPFYVPGCCLVIFGRKETAPN